MKFSIGHVSIWPNFLYIGHQHTTKAKSSIQARRVHEPAEDYQPLPLKIPSFRVCQETGKTCQVHHNPTVQAEDVLIAAGDEGSHTQPSLIRAPPLTRHLP